LARAVFQLCLEDVHREWILRADRLQFDAIGIAEGSRFECDVQELGGSLTMLKAFGDNPQGERLNPRHRLVAVDTVAHDPGQCWYFGQPPAVSFALTLDRKSHSGIVE